MKVALLGSAPSSVRLAPFMDASHAAWAGGKVQAYPPALFADQEWHIWPCSPGAFGIAPRADVWFELHRWEPGQPWFSPEYCQFLREFKGPVYTGGSIPEITNHVVYPIAEVEAEFSSFFLNSSLSLMAAIAILAIEDLRTIRKVAASNPEAVSSHAAAQRLAKYFPDPDRLKDELAKEDADDTVGFWGVDMSANEEYSRQKPGCWFFMLEIMRRGIGLYLPPESDLGRPEPIYGIAEWDHQYIKQTARAREISNRIQEHQTQLKQLEQQMVADLGARDDLNYQVKTWCTPYGIPHGSFVRSIPGTGLGTGVRTVDGKPVK